MARQTESPMGRLMAAIRGLPELLATWDREAREAPLVEGPDGEQAPALPQDESNGRTITVILVSTFSLLLLHFIVLSKQVQRNLSGWIVGTAEDLLGLQLWSYTSLVEGIVWSLGCGFFYILVPATIIRAFWKEPLSAYGFTGRGYWRHLKWYALLFLPVGILVLLVSFQPAFNQKYPFYDEVRGMSDFLVWELFYGMQFIFLEFFFRGFMIHGTKRRLGIYSVFWMVAPYMMIHFGKPMLEATGAIIAGTVLGFLSLRTKSVFGGATIHITVAITMDFMALYQRGFFQ
jgi:uncharacterized protein